MATFTFRAVGIYCFLPNQEFSAYGISETSTVQQIMNAIQAKNQQFSYDNIEIKPGKNIVDEIEFDFKQGDKVGPNASNPFPNPGEYEIDGTVLSTPGADSVVWQFYRNVVATDGAGNSFTFVVPQPGQPSYTTVKLNDGVAVPDGFTITDYQLIWRAVNIQLSPDNPIRIARRNLVRDARKA